MPKPKDGIKLSFDNYREFGKFMMNMRLLHSKNILLIKYPNSYAPVPKLRRTTISNRLKQVLINLYDTNEINYPLLKQCSQEEKNIFDFLMEKSALNIQLHYEKSKMKYSLGELIDRFDIIRGIILAGNNNPELLDEAKTVILELVEHKKIEKEDADEILEEFKKCL